MVRSELKIIESMDPLRLKNLLNHSDATPSPPAKILACINKLQTGLETRHYNQRATNQQGSAANCLAIQTLVYCFLSSNIHMQSAS